MVYLRYLAQLPFSNAYNLQRELWSQRVAGEIPNQLLLLEHPPVITLGRNSRPEHLLISRERLQERGIELVETDRGGDVTYHGPGQLIGYPIIDLKPDRMDVLRYLRDLEKVLIQVLWEFGLIAQRRPGYTGVWIENRKIASIGVKISRWVTYHGFALNVHTDLSAFNLIVPCGISQCRMTSIKNELGQAPSLPEVAEVVAIKMNGMFTRPEPDSLFEPPSKVSVTV